MKKSLLSFALVLAATPAFSVVLTQAPSPMTQISPSGAGMSHINVGWNEFTSSLQTHVDFQPVDLKPLSLWQPGNSFEPASPWYATLDPAQGAAVFNSQYGLLADSASLPEALLGSRFIVEVAPGGNTIGLGIYRSSYMGDIQTFDPILGTNGSAGTMQWTGTMMHPMFVLPSTASGSAAVTLRFTITDGAYVPLVGINPVDATVTFNVIPEPSLAALSVLGGSMFLRRRRALS